MLEDNLMVDTIRKTCGLVTTLSKTADNKLREAKKPVVAIIDSGDPFGLGTQYRDPASFDFPR